MKSAALIVEIEPRGDYCLVEQLCLRRKKRGREKDRERNQGRALSVQFLRRTSRGTAKPNGEEEGGGRILGGNDRGR